MRYLYSLILTILLPLAFVRLRWRARRLPAYNLRWLERLGIFADPKLQAGGLWLHAVSVGEVVAAIPLIRALQQRAPARPITITTTTPTGSELVRRTFNDTVTHVYLPYDLPWCINNFLGKIRPQQVIIMETELWPNLLHICNKRGMQIVIANARLSDKSFNNYRKIKWLMSDILNNVTCVAAQSTQDAQRFLQLGLSADKINITGNLKFDVEFPKHQSKINDRIVWVAASTHRGEEEIVLQVYKQLKQQFPNLLLILVPRHPDRFAEVADLLNQHQLSFQQHSKKEQLLASTQILLGDTMGDLGYFYALADLTFVGGSLVPIGGHNLLEPAGQGVPIVTGPHITNFREIANKLLHAKAMAIINSGTELFEQLRTWCAQPQQRLMIGQQGLAVVDQNRGAVAKTLGLLCVRDGG